MAPADDLAAVEVHDRGQIKPALLGLDVGDVGEPDPVRRGGDEVALEQVRGDREVVTAVGSARPSWPPMMALIPWRRINRSMRPRLAPRP